MAYSPFDETKPDGNDAGTSIPGEAKVNDNALRDMVIMAQAAGFALTVTPGTGTAAQPQYWVFAKSAIIVRATLTWGTSGGQSGNITVIKWERSTNSGSSYDPILAGDQAFTYDGSGNLTGATNAGGAFTFFLYLLGQIKAAIALLVTHLNQTLGAHGIGTLAAQDDASVDINGGSVTGIVLEYQTARGKKVSLGNITGNPFNIDWAAGDYFYGTLTANATLAWQNLPGAGANPAGSITLELTNPGAFTLTWPTGVKWDARTAPTRTASGVDIAEFSCRDAATVRGHYAKDNG